MGKPVIILGAHELGKIALEVLQRSGFVVYGFLDDDHALQGQAINHVPILGNTAEEQYMDLIGEQCDVFIAVAQQAKRQRLAAMLHEQRRIVPVNAIHPSAIIAESASFGCGNLVGASVNVGAGATVGSYCMLHTQATIEYDVVIKDFVQIGTGGIVGANATLDERVFIGAGAVVVAGLCIGAKASVGAGSIVLANVKSGQAVLGNPATSVKIQRAT